MAHYDEHEEDVEGEKTLAALLEGRGELKKEIEEILIPYRHTNKKPKFTDAEFVAMAIICSPSQHVSNREIRDWMRKTFYFYRVLAENLVLDQHPFARRRRFHSLDVIPDPQISEIWDISVETTQPILRDEDGEGNSVYSIRPGPARVCLRRLVEPERKGCFRFLDLPAELRNRIYELVLSFPSCSIDVSSHAECGKPALVIETSLFSCTCAIPTPDHCLNNCSYGKVYEGRHVQEQLESLLPVCHQIHDEAMPIFYGSNTFLFLDSVTLSIALDRLSPRRIKYFKRVHFYLKNLAPTMESFARMKALDKLPPLDEFGVITSDHFLAKPRNISLECPSPCRKFSSIEALVKTAAAAKKLQIYKYGLPRDSCEAFEAFLKREINEIGPQLGIKVDN